MLWLPGQDGKIRKFSTRLGNTNCLIGRHERVVTGSLNIGGGHEGSMCKVYDDTTSSGRRKSPGCRDLQMRLKVGAARLILAQHLAILDLWLHRQASPTWPSSGLILPGSCRFFCGVLALPLGGLILAVPAMHPCPHVCGFNLGVADVESQPHRSPLIQYPNWVISLDIATYNLYQRYCR